MNASLLLERRDKVKTFLKNWEESFKTKNGRAATKDDVSHRPRLLEKYKSYASLKKQCSAMNLDAIAADAKAEERLRDNSVCIPNSPVRWQPASSKLSFLHNRVQKSSMRIPESPDVGATAKPFHVRLKERSSSLYPMSPEQVANIPTISQANRVFAPSPLRPSNRIAVTESMGVAHKRNLSGIIANTNSSHTLRKLPAKHDIGNTHINRQQKSMKRGYQDAGYEDTDLADTHPLDLFVQKSRKVNARDLPSSSPMRCTVRRENSLLANKLPKQRGIIRRASSISAKHGSSDAKRGKQETLGTAASPQKNWQSAICNITAFTPPAPAYHPVVNVKRPRHARSLYQNEDDECTAKPAAEFIGNDSLSMKQAKTTRPEDTTRSANMTNIHSQQHESKQELVQGLKSTSSIMEARKPLSSQTKTIARKLPSAAVVANAPTRKPTQQLHNGQVSNNFVKLNMKRGYRSKSRVKRGRNQVGFAAGFGRKGSTATSSRAKTDTVRRRKDNVDECFEELSGELQRDPPIASIAEETDDEESDPLHLPPAQTPTCTGHGEPSVCKVVKKKNANCGRRFFGCRYGTRLNGGCGFFQWADDVRATAVRAFNKEETEEDFTDSRRKVLVKSWNSKSMPELKAILRRWHGATSGKKGDLVDRLEKLFIEGVNDARELRTELRAKMSKLEQRKFPTKIVSRTLETVFGFDSLRPGQEWAIHRCLGGESSLLVQPTGAGKSLCFQLPSFLLPGLTLVITPLISLMDDQLHRLPPAIAGACLHGRMSKVETSTVLRAVRAGHVDILFISPERLCSESFRGIIRGGILSNLSLVCVDEAHCISAWSHNFRPSYMRINSVLTDPDLDLPKCPVLALTATATLPVVRNVCSMLNIEPPPISTKTEPTALSGGGVLVGDWSRPELRIVTKVVGQDNRLRELLNLLRTDERLAHPHPVIIYANTKNEVNVLVERLQAELQQGTKKGSSIVRPYHAGLQSVERSKTQELFMSNKVRIIVATVAFGMGIDKSDVRAVVHYGMPRSVDNFVQELGRAGRDGELAWGFVLFDHNDAFRLHSLAHSDDLDVRQIRGVLANLHLSHCQHPAIKSQTTIGASQCKCLPGGQQLELALDANIIRNELNLNDSVLETLLVQLSLAPYNIVQRMYSSNMRVSCNLLKTPLDVKNLDEIVVKVLKHLTLLRGSSNRLSDILITSTAAEIGISSKQFCAILRRLQDERAISGLDFKGPSFVLTSNTCFGSTCENAHMDYAAEALTETAHKATKAGGDKVERIYDILSRTVSEPSTDCAFPEAHDTINDLIQTYFIQEDTTCSSELKHELPWTDDDRTLTLVQSDITALLNSSNLNGLPFQSHLATCVLHAVPNALVTYETWSRNPYWGKWRTVPFAQIKQIANEFEK